MSIRQGNNFIAGTPDVTGKADTDLSNISSSGQKVIDGQWVGFVTTTIVSGASQNTSADVEYDLSSILPNDNYNYEVIINGGLTTGSSQGNSGKITLSSSLMNDGNVGVVRTQTRANSSVVAESSIILPVGTDRKIVKRMDTSSSASGTYYLNTSAYRRIGTNS